MSAQRQKAGSEHVAWVQAGDAKVEVVGCWDEQTPDEQYEFYDLYLNDECINLGEPCYTYPTVEHIAKLVKIWTK
jgi:hypothetical protein